MVNMVVCIECPFFGLSDTEIGVEQNMVVAGCIVPSASWNKLCPCGHQRQWQVHCAQTRSGVQPITAASCLLQFEHGSIMEHLAAPCTLTLMLESFAAVHSVVFLQAIKPAY